MTSSTGIDSDTPISLPERMDFAACKPLADAIRDRRGRPLLLDAGNVRFLGALAAEILLRARAEWQADGQAFNLVEPSDGFLKGLSLLGIPQKKLTREGFE